MAGKGLTKGRPAVVATVVAAALALGSLAGCFAEGGADHISFSPDGNAVAFSWHDGVGGWIGVGLSGFGWGLTSEYVHWCRTDQPDRLHTIRTHSGVFVSAGGGIDADDVEHLIFSPDSEHLAIVTVSRLLIVDLASGEHWRLPRVDGGINAVAWIANDELAYGETVFTGKEAGAYYVRVCRQKTAPDGPQAVEVYREDDNRTPRGFSPNGRYLLLAPCPWGRARLLDVLTGQVQDIGPRLAMLHSVAWKPDSSAAFCAIQSHWILPGLGVGLPLAQEFYLVEPEARRVRKTHQQSGKLPARRFDPLWTADGRYVVDNVGWAEISLIRPQPWQEIPLKDKLIQHLEFTELSRRSPELSPLAVAGWLWTRGPDGKVYAVDYAGERFIHIADGWRWALSPDGKRIVEVDGSKKVTVKPLALPPAAHARPTEPHDAAGP